MIVVVVRPSIGNRVSSCIDDSMCAPVQISGRCPHDETKYGSTAFATASPANATSTPTRWPLKTCLVRVEPVHWKRVSFHSFVCSCCFARAHRGSSCVLSGGASLCWHWSGARRVVERIREVLAAQVVLSEPTVLMFRKARGGFGSEEQSTVGQARRAAVQNRGLVQEQPRRNIPSSEGLSV
jgi:hypothetical protein